MHNTNYMMYTIIKIDSIEAKTILVQHLLTATPVYTSTLFFFI